MIIVCHNCGEYHADKIIGPSGPSAICPGCQHHHRFRRLPLLIVGRPSGVGKTTVCERLTGKLVEAIVLDADILWRAEFNKPVNHYRDFLKR